MLIGLTLAGMVAIAVSIAGGIWFLKDIASKAKDPQYMQQTANRIARFAEPLPPGFRFTSAFGLLGYNLVTVEQPARHQLFIFMSYPINEDLKPEELIERMYKTGLNTPGTRARFVARDEAAEWQVAGQKMPYIIARMTDHEGNSYPGFLGCLILNKGQRCVLVYGMQVQGDSYDLETTEKLIGSIRSF